MKVIKIIEHQDGSATMEYEVTTKERATIKSTYGIKRLTNKKLNSFIRKAIVDYVKRRK